MSAAALESALRVLLRSHNRHDCLRAETRALARRDIAALRHLKGRQ